MDKRNNETQIIESTWDITELSAEELNTLRQIARRFMNKENPGHTLQATALVNEAYLSLHSANLSTVDKVHFFALAASHMRRILIDHARASATKKRQAQALAVTIHDNVLGESEDFTSLLFLDQLLCQFAELDKRAASMFEMRLFAGLSNNELSQVYNVSLATVERDIKIAKAWINKALKA